MDSWKYLSPGLLNDYSQDPAGFPLEKRLLAQGEASSLQIIMIQPDGDFNVRVKISDGSHWVYASMSRFKKTSPTKENCQ